MQPIKTLLIERSLLKKGFVKDNRHHKVFWLYDGDRKTTVHTQISHGKKEYDSGLLKAMQKQLRLTGHNEFFQGLLKCPVSGDQYLDKLRMQGDVKP